MEHFVWHCLQRFCNYHVTSTARLDPGMDDHSIIPAAAASDFKHLNRSHRRESLVKLAPSSSRAAENVCAEKIRHEFNMPAFAQSEDMLKKGGGGKKKKKKKKKSAASRKREEYSQPGSMLAIRRRSREGRISGISTIRCSRTWLWCRSFRLRCR